MLTESFFVGTAAAVGRATGEGITCTGFVRCNAELYAVRFRLEHNGLTIVLMVDQRAPVFAYQSWFRVGSKHENPNLTGMAHLFEHLMFKATKSHPAGELDREMERRGAETNAATWVDWTYYLQTLATRGDNLETVIAFEADRMANLLLDETTFRTELEVVKNERRMSVDDSINGELSERLYSEAFTQHPYRWPTIGAMEHLEKATVADLDRFYRTFYSPNNATVVVVGDIDVSDTLASVVRGYASLEAHPVPAPTNRIEPPQTQARAVVLQRPVVTPQILIGFHCPAQDHLDYGAVEMLGEILNSGDNARLYDRLVTREKLASDVAGYVAPFCEPGLYEISVAARPEVPWQRIMEVVQEEVDGLARCVNPSEINKARAGLEVSYFDSLKEAQGCAEALGVYETNFRDFGRAFCGVERWSALDVADLQRVAGEVFDCRNRTTVVAESGE